MKKCDGLFLFLHLTSCQLNSWYMRDDDGWYFLKQSRPTFGMLIHVLTTHN